MDKLKKWQKVSGFSGLGLSSLSAILSILLMMNFSATGFSKAILMCVGFCLSLCQPTTYVISWIFIIRKEHEKALPALVVFVGCFVISQVGSIGFFYTTVQQLRSESRVSDDRYKLLKSEMEALDKRQAELSADKEKYHEMNWYTKGVKPTEKKIEELQVRKDELLQKIMTYESSDNTTNEYFKFWASFFDSKNPNEIEFMIFTIISFMLDLSSCVLLGYSIGFSVMKKMAFSIPPTESLSVDSPSEQFDQIVKGLYQQNPQKMDEALRTNNRKILEDQLSELIANNPGLATAFVDRYRAPEKDEPKATKAQSLPEEPQAEPEIDSSRQAGFITSEPVEKTRPQKKQSKKSKGKKKSKNELEQFIKAIPKFDQGDIIPGYKTVATKAGIKSPYHASLCYEQLKELGLVESVVANGKSRTKALLSQSEMIERVRKEA
jgi:hypothetical protein